MRLKRDPDEERAHNAPEPQEQAASESMEPRSIEEELDLAKAQLQGALDGLKAMAEELSLVSSERDSWKSKAAEIHDQYLRARSDMEGFRKRVERDFDDRLTRSVASFMTNLLEVMDNFDRSIEALEAPSAETGTALEPFLKGVSMIRAQMLDALLKEGVEPIPCPVGQIMDPALHEAVLAQEGGGEHGTVVLEMQKGYKFKNLILRATKVTVIR